MPPAQHAGEAMAKTRGTGLLMVWADIDPEYEAEYHRWYDEEHTAHLLAVPGFLSAGRYIALKGGPKYLALYELESPDVLKSPAFLDGVRLRPPARRWRHERPHFSAERLPADLPCAHQSDRADERPGAVSADGPDRRPRDG